MVSDHVREREREYSFMVIVTPWLLVETVTLIASGSSQLMVDCAAQFDTAGC